MKREAGDKRFPVWLLGDSNPLQWQDNLDTPLDPRHPVRHNISTAVFDVVQDRVFRACRLRADSSRLYIRNAVESPLIKPPSNRVEWAREVESEMRELIDLVQTYRPALLLCFGAFAYEFARRALDSGIYKRNYGHWGARELGREFDQRIAHFDAASTNILPLLHRSISGGKFIQSHDYFCNQAGANYFEYVGNRIAERLIENREKLHIWIV